MCIRDRCKVATIGKVYDDKGKFVGYEDDSIGDQDFSLNPGRYVGVVIEDDGLTQDEFCLLYTSRCV